MRAWDDYDPTNRMGSSLVKPTRAPRAQTMPSTPPNRAEKGTARPSKSAKLAMPPAPQPVPQVTRRGGKRAY